MTTKEIIEISNLSPNAQELAREGQGAPDYIRQLQEKELYRDAISFRAHERDIKPVIEWAAVCVRELEPKSDQPEDRDSMKAVDQWRKLPSDSTRWAARQTADKSGMSLPGDCLAMAVFFSGGSISPPGATQTPPPAYAANKLAAASIVFAVLSQTPERANERYRRAMELLP